MALGVYVHIPFCLRRCGYCSFASQTDYSLQEAYFARLHEEIRSFGQFSGRSVSCDTDGIPTASGGAGESGERKGAREPCGAESCAEADTVYFGGGTPSSVSPDLLAGALREVYGRFSVSADAEITMECNPATVTEAKAEVWLSAGFNRFSVGLQSANDRTLERIGRLHRARDFVSTAAILRRAGGKNLSADLILGLPGEKLSDVLASARFALDAGIDHLSAYGLSVEPGTPLAAQGYRVDEDLAADCYEGVVALCAEYGLKRYEVSNFARPGRECRHNLKYWRMRDYAGFGLSAHSLIGDLRTFRTSEMAAYLAGSQPLIEERLTGNARAEETLMLGLRTAGGVPLDCWRASFGYDLQAAVAPALKKYAGYLEIADGALRFCDRGFYVMNGIVAGLLNLLPADSGAMDR